MQLIVKLQADLLCSARADLQRPHAHALERVGFFIAKPAWLSSAAIALIVTAYFPVADEDYLQDDQVGASIGSAAMRKALQEAYRAKASLLHVHAHVGRGKPRFSNVDLASSQAFVPAFFNVIPDVPHGVLVLSDDCAAGLVWVEQRGHAQPVTRFVQPSAPFMIYGEQDGKFG